MKTILCLPLLIVSLVSLTVAQEGSMICRVDESSNLNTLLTNITEQCGQLCSCETQVSTTEGGSTSDPDENLGIAFALVTAAGLSTTFGASLVFCDSFVSKANSQVLAASLGFSAGVMLLVSLVEILIKSQMEFAVCNCLWTADDATPEEHSDAAFVMSIICFFVGIIITYILDFFVHMISGGHGHSHNTASGNKGHGHSHSHSEHGEDDVTVDVEVGSARGKVEPTTSDDTIPADAIEDIRSPEGTPAAHTHSSACPHNNSSDNASIPVCMCEVDNIVEMISEHNKHEHDKKAKEIALGSAEEAVVEADKENTEEENKLEHMSLMTALAIALHNFPEGLATFVATLDDPLVGASLAVAIAIHNIPEGLCISIPVYYSSGSRWKGFWLAFWSGVTELIGAGLGYAFLRNSFGPPAYAILFGLVAGMMVAIVLKELIPTAHRYDPQDKYVTSSIFAGMIIMALSLVLFKV